MKMSKSLLAAAALAIGASASGAQAASKAAKSVVLVHGAFVDGSGWKDVHGLLTKRGFNVTIVQNSTESFEGDVAATRRAIAEAEGPVVLVGHSYGGVVISEAGNDPKVSGLVYIAAFAADKGESVGSLKADPAPGDPVPPIVPAEGGYLLVERAKFPQAFAADVEPGLARFMADSQIPWNAGALNATVSKPAWRDKRSWYVVATEDQMIPVAAQRRMAERAGASVLELSGSHAIFVSKPAEVAAAIEQAAQGGAGR